MLKRIDTLIIDLDNTIFDWFKFWHASFEPIYENILSASNNSKDEVEADIRRVHQKYRTSEYLFLIEELTVLNNIDENGDRREQFCDAIVKSRRGRDKNLRLYEGVFNSLWAIKNKGTKIIAYTESISFYSAYRLKRFGLDGVIDILYTAQDHTHLQGLSVDNFCRSPNEFHQLEVTETKHTPLGELKPNSKLLKNIMDYENVKIENCAYVGDNLFKDVAMARDVGILDIHAKYGENQKNSEYSLLQRVSHWTEDDILREKEITRRGYQCEPSVVLKKNFTEIFMYCDFQTFNKNLQKSAIKMF
ncbi:MAG: HAD family hydrolase [Alphaproteobacteria bacterium]|nr:HAD family hydrolase [Alphaproteobacteria bacterium]